MSDEYFVYGPRKKVGTEILSDGSVAGVDFVNADNRFDVNPGNPHLKIALMSEDLSKELFRVYIPRTREMPDAVIYRGKYYEVVNTRLKPPQYRDVMVSTAYDNPENKETDNGTP